MPLDTLSVSWSACKTRGTWHAGQGCWHKAGPCIEAAHAECGWVWCDCLRQAHDTSATKPTPAGRPGDLHLAFAITMLVCDVCPKELVITGHDILHPCVGVQQVQH